MTKFLKDKCDIHGETDFYIYKGKANKCAACARKSAKDWKFKNQEYVKKYATEWNKKNQERLNALSKKNLEIRKQKNLEKKQDFYKKFGDYINDVASGIYLEKIPRSIRHIKNPTNDKVFDFLVDSKRAQLKSQEIFRVSTLVKWKHLKSQNLRSATEEQKSIIREEYKRKAKEIVDIKMKEILENYNNKKNK